MSKQDQKLDPSEALEEQKRTPSPEQRMHTTQNNNTDVEAVGATFGAVQEVIQVARIENEDQGGSATQPSVAQDQQTLRRNKGSLSLPNLKSYSRQATA